MKLYCAAFLVLQVLNIISKVR